MNFPLTAAVTLALAVAAPVSTAVAQGPTRIIREIDPAMAPEPGPVIAVVGGTLIDGRGRPPIEGAVVVIRGNRILAAGRVAVPAGAVRVDAAGASILPGLIDAHFHLDGDHGLPRLFLEHGVTSVRDPGAWIEAFDSVRRIRAELPRLFLAGPHLDSPPPAYPEDSYLVRDPTEARRAVDRFVDQGASVIKAYFRLPIELLSAVVEAAHRRGVPVTTHLEIVSATDAIAAGVDGIEHVTSFGTALQPLRDAERYRQAIVASNEARRAGRYAVWSGLDLQSARSKAVIAAAVRSGVIVTPTLAVFERRAGDRGATEPEVEGFRRMMAFTGMLHRAGVRVVVGSHSSVPHAERGWAYQREAELLVESGLSPVAVIRAATLDNARFFRIDERLGSLEPGKLADLIVVDGRPDRDIGALRRVKAVMVNGRWVSSRR